MREEKALAIELVVSLLCSMLIVSFPITNVTSYSTAKSLDFKRELFGDLSSMSMWFVNFSNTGEVTINGVDTKRPTIPFTWDWGDGTIYEDWWPQKHTYLDKTRNYILNVTAHYPEGKTDSAKLLIRFISPVILPISLSSDIAITIPNHPVKLTSRMLGYGISTSLTYFGDNFFSPISRSDVEYILTAAASIQRDFVNDNVYLINGSFRQVLLRDSSFPGMYSLWYTSPVGIGAGDYVFQRPIQWSSIFHEMGHNFVLNSPSSYYYGGKIDGNANAIFSEAMAQIFQHATAYELINNAGRYGLSEDIVFEIEQNALQSMWGVRRSYDDYVNSGMKFSSWNDPATPMDETFNTFMTIAYKFFIYAENSGSGYKIPLKRMMSFLQTFDSDLRERYSQYSNTPTAESFRATFMVAALSYAFGEDLRKEFKDLNFPINDETYNELMMIYTVLSILPPSSVRVKESAMISGSISPTFSGAQITVQVFGPESAMLSATTQNGQFSVVFIPHKAGKYDIQATFSGDTEHRKSQSQVVSFEVTKIPTSLTLTSTSITPISIDLLTRSATMVSISGSITPGFTTTIQLAFVDPSGASKTETIQTSDNGTFVASFVPFSSGTYRVQASFQGDDQYQTSSNEISFNVVANYVSLIAVIVFAVVIILIVLIYYTRTRLKRAEMESRT